MCIEGFRMEEACGRPRPGRALPPGIGTPITAVDSTCAYPCRRHSEHSQQQSDASCSAAALTASVPDATRGRERTPPDLSARDRVADLSLPPAHAAGVPDDMEAADNDDGNPGGPHHPVDADLAGANHTRESIAAARARLMQRLLARTALEAKKTAASAGARAAPSTVPEQDLDLLARVTAKFSVLLHRLGDALETAQRSHYYSVLSRTTQPAHLVAFLAVALVAALLFPRAAYSTTASSGPRGAGLSQPSPWTYLAYVVAFAAHFGSQFWMTFVSGLSLFFSLPRHHFAAVQKVLFPLYFAINAALSLVTLASFVHLQPAASRWDAEVVTQVASMVLCFVLELVVRLYLTPPLLHLITAKTEMEKTVEGVGEEVGRYDLGPLTQCPHYVRIHRAFRKVHVTIAMANIAAMACTALHAHFLAGKICV